MARILIADDDKDTTLLLMTILRKAGHQVSSAQDAAQAMMMSQRDPRPELVVLDIQMPGGTGVGYLEKLRSNSRTFAIPVLVITGTRNEVVFAHLNGLGVFDIQLKPIDPDAFPDLVQRALSTP